MVCESLIPIVEELHPEHYLHVINLRGILFCFSLLCLLIKNVTSNCHRFENFCLLVTEVKKSNFYMDISHGKLMLLCYVSIVSLHGVTKCQLLWYFVQLRRYEGSVVDAYSGFHS